MVSYGNLSQKVDQAIIHGQFLMITSLLSQGQVLLDLRKWDLQK